MGLLKGSTTELAFMWASFDMQASFFAAKFSAPSALQRFLPLDGLAKSPDLDQARAGWEPWTKWLESMKNSAMSPFLAFSDSGFRVPPMNSFCLAASAFAGMKPILRHLKPFAPKIRGQPLWRE
jgi:hypothetical protein